MHPLWRISLKHAILLFFRVKFKTFLTDVQKKYHKGADKKFAREPVETRDPRVYPQVLSLKQEASCKTWVVHG